MHQTAPPLVTIIIPYGPGYSYSMVLDSIKQLDYPLDRIEVIAVEGKQPAHQRNEALAAANGEFVFFFDDDVTLDKNIIRRMLRFYEDHEVTIVGGPNLTPPSDSFIQQCFGYVMGSSFVTGKTSQRWKPSGTAREATENDLILCNMSGRTSVLKENLFDERLWPGEEIDFLVRLRKQGFKAIYDPESIVYHSRRTTVGKFSKQIFGYACGRAEALMIHPAAFEAIYLVPSLFVLYLLSLPLAVTISSFSRSLGLLYCAPLLLYIGVDLLASLRTAIQNRHLLAAVVLPLLFPLAHVSYGLGLLRSFLFRTIHRKELSLHVRMQRVALTQERTR